VSELKRSAEEFAMKTETEIRKKEAVRLAFWYPGVFLMAAVFLGVIISSGSNKIPVHNLDNAVRGMTALSMLALVLASWGYIKLKRCV
jgi:hypothetical protein